jgi:hypothetical protein
MVRLLCLMLLFVAPAPAPTQEPTTLQAKLDFRVSEYSVSAKSLADALARTSQRFQLPIGIEWVRDEHAIVAFRRTWKDETVEGILHSIVKAYPGYDFQIDDGVVHVFRQDLLNDSHNFLNIKLPEFYEAHREAAGLINQGLRSVVQNIVSPRDLPPGAGEGGEYATGIHEKPLNISLRGATIRQALNKLASVSEHNLWVVTFSDTIELTPTGFRRTETLWHPKPFPNTQQPMWDFLAWTEYQPELGATDGRTR